MIEVELLRGRKKKKDLRGYEPEKLGTTNKESKCTAGQLNVQKYEICLQANQVSDNKTIMNEYLLGLKWSVSFEDQHDKLN